MPRCVFDPTANRFVDEIASLYPENARAAVASSFVYSVAGMLALITSQWRMSALGDARADKASHLDELVAFGAAGIDAAARRVSADA